MSIRGMKRRVFIAALGGAAAMPLAVRAQQPTMPVIGFLGPASATGYAPHLKGFRQGLGEAGFVEGETIAVEYRWTDVQQQGVHTPHEDARDPREG